ncbi:response regulator transcription factor [Microbacterium gorillae]|uniref:response regulator transcription factor n=1 Tax=Microbacterium gorillae TaxID=1231063 RepID=UPI00058D50E4|nr:response regulator [Microbacterium gorillae]
MTAYHEVVVHVIDDDDDHRDSIIFLLQSVGLTVLTYPSAMSFLEEFDPDEPAVAVVDVRMPGMSGLQLQEELIRRRYPGRVIFCSAHGDISMSVRAMRSGAVDFLEKPYEPQRLLDAVQAQLPVAAAAFDRAAERKAVQERIGTLTAREMQVLALVVDGLPSQAIAQRLGTSVKTIDVHRAHIRSKTDAEGLGALVRDVLLHRIPLPHDR